MVFNEEFVQTLSTIQLDVLADVFDQCGCVGGDEAAFHCSSLIKSRKLELSVSSFADGAEISDHGS